MSFNPELLKDRTIMVVGDATGSAEYISALEQSGARVVKVTEDINWDEPKYAGQLGRPIVLEYAKVDAVVIMNPDIDKYIKPDGLENSLLRFSSAMQQQNIPVIVQDQSTLGAGMKRFLQGEGIAYCDAEERAKDLPANVFLAIGNAERNKGQGGWRE